MKNLKQSVFKEAANQIISNKLLRGMAVKQMDKFLYKSLMDIGRNLLEQEKLDQYAFMTSIVHQVKRNLDKGFIKPEVMKKMAKVFVGDSYTPDRHKKLSPEKEAYKEKYGDYPPQFLVLSPGKGCNLHCTGCYASADSAIAEKLDFETTRRIVKEAHYHFKKMGKYMIADVVSMKDLKKNHLTKIIMTNIKINQGLKDTMFTVENLKNGF